MNSLFNNAISYFSRLCGLESLDSFPAGHAFARTRWNPAYFDIPYGTHPDQIERMLCTAIENTPSIFVHIVNPTPRMQRALLLLLDESLRRGDGAAAELLAMLVNAYTSPHVQDALPGLRAAIVAAQFEEEPARMRSVLEFLARMNAPFDVIDA